MWEKVRSSTSSLVRQSSLVVKRTSYSKLEDESLKPIENVDNLDNEYIDGCEVIANVGCLERRDSDSSYESCKDDIACYNNNNNNSRHSIDGIKLGGDNGTSESYHSRVMKDMSNTDQSGRGYREPDCADAGFTRNAHPFWEQLYSLTSKAESKTGTDEEHLYSLTSKIESIRGRPTEEKQPYSPKSKMESRRGVEEETLKSEQNPQIITEICTAKPDSVSKLRDALCTTKLSEKLTLEAQTKPSDVRPCEYKCEIKRRSSEFNSELNERPEMSNVHELTPTLQLSENKHAHVTFAELPVSVTHVVVRRRSKGNQHPHNCTQRQNVRKHSLSHDVSGVVKREVTHAVNKVRPGTMKEYKKLNDSFEDVSDDDEEINLNDHTSNIHWHRTFPAQKSKQKIGTKGSRAKRKTRKALRRTGRALWGSFKWLRRGVRYYVTNNSGFQNMFSAFATYPK